MQEKLEICMDCKRTINEEYFIFNSGGFWCKSCFENFYKRFYHCILTYQNEQKRKEEKK